MTAPLPRGAAFCCTVSCFYPEVCYNKEKAYPYQFFKYGRNHHAISEDRHPTRLSTAAGPHLSPARVVRLRYRGRGIRRLPRLRRLWPAVSISAGSCADGPIKTIVVRRYCNIMKSPKRCFILYRRKSYAVFAFHRVARCCKSPDLCPCSAHYFCRISVFHVYHIRTSIQVYAAG